MNFEWLSWSILQSGSYHLTLGHVLLALLILVISFYISKVIRDNTLRLVAQKNNAHMSQAYAFTRFIHYALILLGIMLSLSVLGIDMSKLAIVAGALGIGVGLGLQELVKNFVSGIVILLEKSLKVGDFVELDSNIFGLVKEINFRSTLIRTNDNVDILVPNADLVSNKVINWTLEESRARVRIEFSVAYGSDKTLVRTAALEAAANVAHTLKDPKLPPTVWFTGFGDSSLNFVLGVWVDYDAVIKPTALKSDYLWAIDDAFRKYHIEIPFPQRDVYIKKMTNPENKMQPNHQHDKD